MFGDGLEKVTSTNWDPAGAVNVARKLILPLAEKN
jgi:hypothetical protein